MSEVMVLDIETSGNDPWSGDLLAVGLGGVVYPPDAGREACREAMATPGNVLVCHTTYDMRWMILDGAHLRDGVDFHDTKVMAWSLDATQELTLDALVEKYCGFRPDKRITTRANRLVFRCDDGTYVPIAEAPWDQMKAYNQSDIDSTTELYHTLKSQMQQRGLWDLFLAEEVPFSRLLVEVETTGMPFDVEACLEMRGPVEAAAARQRQDLIDAVGVAEFNPGSNNQVSDLLYSEQWTLKSRIAVPRMNGLAPEVKLEVAQQLAPEAFLVDKVGRDYAHGRYVLPGRGLKAPKIAKDKPADARPSVSRPVLQVMHATDPWVADYLTWRKIDKLLTGFLNVWPDQAHNGRLYGRLDQSATVTGRLAGREPNLQQVPSADEFGVRALFCGDLVVGDYAGLEVRLSAHFSQDPVMLDIFRSGKDLYGTMAAHAWGGPETKQNERRGLMKVVMLGSQYGARGEKLANVLALAGMMGWSGAKADGLLKDLEHTLPRLFEWRNEVIAEGRHLGYVTTLAGRKRHLPDINSAVWKLMALSERQAVNSKVQGSAADIVRRAMLEARRQVDPEAARIIMQVHDEVLWERGRAWTPALLDVMQDVCENGHGFELSVPLVFEPIEAQSWADKGGGPRSPVVPDLEVAA